MNTLKELSNKIWFRAILFTAGWFATCFAIGLIGAVNNDIGAAFWIGAGINFYVFAIIFWLILDKFILSCLLAKRTKISATLVPITFGLLLYPVFFAVGWRVTKLITNLN